MAAHASLVRDAPPPLAMPGLDIVAMRMANGLRDRLATYGCAGKIGVSLAVQMSFGDWCGEQGTTTALCRYRLAAPIGAVMIAFAPAFISQLVDTYYGGSGQSAPFRGQFSSAEIRFLTRMGEDCAATLASAWSGFADVDPVFADVETDVSAAGFGKPGDVMMVQRFTGADGAQIDCLYPLAALRKLPSLSGEVLNDEEDNIDTTWRDALIDAVMQVHLPVRSIFARPEVPLAKLLSLRAGDVIPVCLPDFLPVTVAGRQFAHGTVGEAGGRAAIKINSIEPVQKGLPHHA